MVAVVDAVDFQGEIALGKLRGKLDGFPNPEDSVKIEKGGIGIHFPGKIQSGPSGLGNGFLLPFGGGACRSRVAVQKIGFPFPEAPEKLPMPLFEGLRCLAARIAENGEILRQSGGFKSVSADPGLNPGSAPGTVNESDRHPEIRLKFSAEKIGDGGKIFNGRGGADLPAGALRLTLRSVERGLASLFEETDLRIVRRQSNLLFRIQTGLDRHRHVRLAGTEPDLAEKNIFKDGFPVRSLDGERIGSARFHGGEKGSPASVTAGFGKHGFSVQSHQNAFSRSSRARDPDRFLRLKHHIVSIGGADGIFSAQPFIAERGARGKKSQRQNNRRQNAMA